MKHLFRLKPVLCLALILALSIGCIAALAECETHDFSAEVPSPEYLAIPATEDSPAIYYYKCQNCNEHGHGTFYYGSPLSSGQKSEQKLEEKNTKAPQKEEESSAMVGFFPHEHSYTVRFEAPQYLAACNCVNGDTYYYKCEFCLACGTETYTGSTYTHSYTDKITEDPMALPEDIALALFSPATCQENVKYRLRCAACKQLSLNDTDVYEVEGTKLDHNFSGEIASPAYLCTPANCQYPATYYYSCIHCFVSCGDPVNVFTDGDFGPHSFTQKIADAAYLYQAANCEHGTLYYKSCEFCTAGSNDPSIIFEDGNPVHSYTEEVPAPQYICEKATCQHGTIFYKSCTCGASSNDSAQSFEFGGTAPHDFSKKDKDTKYLCEAATCQHGDIYFLSCKSCGESSNHPALTFVGSKSLKHSFTAEVANPWYLRDEATCQHAAVYYKSCEFCGVSSMDRNKTFEYGTPCNHNYCAQVAKKNYLISKATCTEGEKYYLSCCWCGKSSNNPKKSFYTTMPLGHDFSAEIHSWYYIASWPDCVHPGLYYKSCTRCGLAGTETFVGDPPTGLHEYIAKVPKSRYLVREADCSHPAVYRYSCICCGEPCKYLTFEYGKAKGHDWTEYIGDNQGHHVSTCDRCGAERTIKCKLIDYKVNDAYSSVCVVCGCDLHSTDLAMLNAVTDTKSRLSPWTKIRVQGKAFPANETAVAGDPLYLMSVGCVRNEKIVKLSNPMEIEVHCPVSGEFELYQLDELGNETKIPYTLDTAGTLRFSAETSTLFLFRVK